MTSGGASRASSTSALCQAVAGRFGLGQVTSCTPVPDGFSHSVFRLQTSEGIFALKKLNTDLSVGGAIDSISVSIAVERAAIAGGVSAPEPLTDGSGRYLAQLGSDDWVRVHRWREGQTRNSSGVSGDEVGRIVEVLAQIHALAIRPTQDRDIEIPSSWQNHLVAAEQLGAGWAGELSVAIAALDLASLWASERPGPATISSHRDVYPRNVLFSGYLVDLLDWDIAGPTTPGEEVAVAAMEWAGGIVEAPDPQRMTMFVQQYQRISGTSVGADRTLYGRWLTRQLRWLDFHLRVALTETQVSAASQSHKRLGFLIPRLCRQLEDMDSWLRAIEAARRS